MHQVGLIALPFILAVLVAVVSGCAANSPAASNAFSYACAAGGSCGAFMVVNGQGVEDKIVAATTTVSDRAELHTVVKDDKGTMAMQQVKDITVPASGVVELKPGSFHVMLFGVKQELKTGDTFPVTLKFEKSGEATVQVQVKDRN